MNRFGKRVVSLARRQKRACAPRLRLLPVLVAMMTLTLSARIGDFCLAISAAPTSAVAKSQGAGKDDAAHPALTPPANETTSDGHAPTPSNSNVRPAPPPLAADPFKQSVPFTETEINMLQKLSERRELLDLREQELQTQTRLLSAAERRIDSKIAELKQLQDTISKLLEKHSAQEQQKIARLVKIYASMKPKDAAGIFNNLDMEILLAILENMKESKAAPILAAMIPDTARVVTARLSRRYRLPTQDNRAVTNELPRGTAR